jgi:glutamate 5-kinase
MNKIQRVVVKIGTSTLTAGSKILSAPRLVEVARQIALLHAEKIQIVLVSSGAIAAGREELGFPNLPPHLPTKQMLAAVGQPRLMAAYGEYFKIYSIHTAQVLLTRADLADKHGYINARATLEALLEQGIIPIINENDTVATDEIRIGDNDNLSAQVATLIEADLLILLTDQEGLYTADPRSDPNAELIREVGPEPFSLQLWQSVGGSVSGLGIGGMVTKLQAADLARHGGTAVVIADGATPNVIVRLVHEESIGTRLIAAENKLESRKRRLISGSRTKAEIVIDAGAVKALTRGGSLLPAGVLKANGTFERGDSVRVVDGEKKNIAIGQTNYSAADLHPLCGQQSAEIESILGYTFGDEVIHRDNLVML